MKRTLSETSSRQLTTQSTLKEYHGNTKNINFQFHHRKFSQQRYSAFSYCNGFSTDCSTKEFIHRFFDKALQKNQETPTCTIFSFMILNLIKKGIAPESLFS